MPIFKVVQDALSPAAVELANRVVVDVAERAGGKFSFDSNDAGPDDRDSLLTLAEAFLDGPVPEIFRSLHGVEPGLCLSITSVRRQKPADAGQMVDWHLDLNFVGDIRPFLVAWTAIEAVGVERSALDVCVPNGQPLHLEAVLRELAVRTEKEAPMVFTSGELDDLLGEDAWMCKSVVAPAGAAAVFDQMILHRSQVLPTATKVRHSIEFRMMDLDNLPAHQRTQPALYARRAPSGDLELFVIRPGERRQLSRDDYRNLRILKR